MPIGILCVSIPYDVPPLMSVDTSEQDYESTIVSTTVRRLHTLTSRRAG